MTLLTRTLRWGWVMPISHEERTRMTTHRSLQGMVLSATFWRSQLCHQRLRAAASRTLLWVVHLRGLRVTPEALIHQHPMVSEMGSLVFVLVSTWWQQSPEQRGAGRLWAVFCLLLMGNGRQRALTAKCRLLRRIFSIFWIVNVMTIRLALTSSGVLLPVSQTERHKYSVFCKRWNLLHSNYVRDQIYSKWSPCS